MAWGQGTVMDQGQKVAMEQRERRIIIDGKAMGEEAFKGWLIDWWKEKDNAAYTKFQDTIDRIVNSGKSVQQRGAKLYDALKKQGLLGLGGTVELMAFFKNGEDGKTNIYTAKEKELLNRKSHNNKNIIYLNSLNNLERLMTAGKLVQKLNDILGNHMKSFYTLLTTKHKAINNTLNFWYSKGWYNQNWNEGGQWPKDMAHAIWGKGRGGDNDHYGYASEAFATHLVEQHKQLLRSQVTSEDYKAELRRIENKHSVAVEYGGTKSEKFVGLLQSAQGNIAGVYSGDVVMIDKNGVVVFNFQVKASIRKNYSYQKAYKSLLSLIEKYKAAWLQYLNSNTIDVLTIKDIFNQASTYVIKEVENIVQNTKT